VLSLGGGIAFLGGIVLVFALSHLLHWSATPQPADVAWLPLWACHAIVGFSLTALGSAFVWAGYKKLQSINPAHSPAGEAMKENVEWAAHPTQAARSR
jgi:Putative Actinobacterial Holin-X, holin superfamily III